MRITAIAVFGTTLVACGGGGGGSTSTLPASTVVTPAPAAPEAPVTTPVSAPTLTNTDADTPVAAPAPSTPAPAAALPNTDVSAPVAGSTTAVTPPVVATYISGAVTDVRVQNTAASVRENMPITFGQVFAVGHMQANETLVGSFDNGVKIPLQIDIKARHADGSVRHAIVSGIVPSLAARETRTLSLLKTNAPQEGGMLPKSLLLNGFSTVVHASINGVRYSASADDLIKNGAPVQTWLSGPVANEWQVSAPLTTAEGTPHPHLAARFAIRWYDSVKKARVDVSIENDWAYEPNPQNITYDAEIVVGGAKVYSKAALNHLHHSRWRKLFWFGGDASQVHLKHNTAYLIDSRALPNYDRGIVTSETTLAGLKAKWTGAAIEPMGVGLAVPAMPGTGGRPDIGLLPGWAATYLLSMDARAKLVTLGTADLAGSWSAHYRDKNTDRPVSLIDYPYMTILGTPTDTVNPATRQKEAFPKCATTAACATPNKHDASHQPAFAYLPYLVTGDYYYLEELQFWGMYNVFQSNPGYRQNVKGLLADDQVRAQAWSMRTLAEAAYITPDGDPLKDDFARILETNLDWYNQRYTNNPAANFFGVIDTSSAVVYGSKRGIAPWQDDFFTSAIGHVAELGFAKAQGLLAWKAKSAAMRMTDPGICWIDGALYSMNIRDSATSPFYTSMAQAAAASQSEGFRSLACASSAMASFLDLKVGEMTGYSSSTMGYPSNMQPALAYAVDARLPNGAAAWARFMSRSVKPNYGTSPQFAIVPR